MFADYHIHLDKLDWTIGTIYNMCRIAEKAGVDRLGIVVHTKILDCFKPLYDHVLSNGKKHEKLKFDKKTDDFINLVIKAKEEGYPVKIGIEACYSLEGEEFLYHKLKEYPFDYVIGSVHLIGDMHYKTAVEKYESAYSAGEVYYGLIKKAVDSGLFDIIGHIELARREGIPGLISYPELLESITKSLAQNSCAVEINTKWLVKHEGIIPDTDTLKYFASSGIKVVFGSDAHHIERIGYAKDSAYDAVKKAGYTSFSVL